MAENDAMNELFVELSETFQHEFSRRIIAFLKDEHKQKRWWVRLSRWLGSIRHLRCICGATGVGCECERPPPPAMPAQRLPVRHSMTRRPMIIHADPPPRVPLVIPPAGPEENPYALTQITEI
jgi:hypothetical protein